MEKNNKIYSEEKSLLKSLKLKQYKNKENGIITQINNKTHNFHIINYRIKILQKKELYLLRIIFIIYIIIPNVAKNYLDKKRILEEDVDKFEIILKVNEQGEQPILSSIFKNLPDLIYVNGIISNISENNTLYVEDKNDIIDLKWNSKLINCDTMFLGLTNIIEIDLSNFNPAYIKSMKYMFKNCINLKKLNFGDKFNTKSTYLMNDLFFNCTSLTSLNLSSFNTSLVQDMTNMFYNCISRIFRYFKF